MMCVEEGYLLSSTKGDFREQHLGRMQEHWQHMHDQCCMMNPVGCSHIGAPSRQ